MTARKPDGFLRLVRDLTVGDPLAKQQERIDEAAKLEAEHTSQAAYHRTLATHYGDRVALIKPHDDPWGFAAARQKQLDHQALLATASERAADASARRRAETTKLAALRERAA